MYTYKKIIFITLPVLMSVLVEQLINITDAIFLGHVGEIELGAAAIAGIYYLVIYMIGFGFSLGLQVLIARKNGEQNYDETGKVFYQGLYILVILSALFLILSQILSPILIRKFIVSDEIYTATMDYLNWRCFGLLFAFPFLAIRSFFVGIVKTNILIISSLAMVTSNIILNYLLIFGYYGLPKLGISGAAIASALSEFIALSIAINYIHFKTNKQYYGLYYTSVNKHIIIILLNISLWSMLYSFISVAPWFVFFIMIEHLGSNQLAIANIIRSISTIFFVIVSSFATTTGALVSNLIGECQKNDIMPLCKKIIRLEYCIGIPLIIMAFLFQPQILGIYTSNEVLIQSAYWTFIVMLANYFLAVPAYVYSNAIIGIGNTKIAFAFQVITVAVYIVYLLFISSLQNTPLSIYWCAEFIFVSVLFCFSYLYIKRWHINNL